MLESDIKEAEEKKMDSSIDLDGPIVSVASSMGTPLPVKNLLNKSHDRIKPLIPLLDFSKIKEHIDMAKQQPEGGAAKIGVQKGSIQQPKYIILY